MQILIQIAAGMIVLFTTLLVCTLVALTFAFEQVIELLRAAVERRAPELVWEDVKVDDFKGLILDCHARWVAILQGLNNSL